MLLTSLVLLLCAVLGAGTFVLVRELRRVLDRLIVELHAEVDDPRRHTYPLPIRPFCGHDSKTIILYPGGVAFCPDCHEKGKRP